MPRPTWESPDPSRIMMTEYYEDNLRYSDVPLRGCRGLHHRRVDGIGTARPGSPDRATLAGGSFSTSGCRQAGGPHRIAPAVFGQYRLGSPRGIRTGAG